MIPKILFIGGIPVPAESFLTGWHISGFEVITASDYNAARSAIAFARVTGSVGASDVYSTGMTPAGQYIPTAERIADRWAIVRQLLPEA